MSDGGIQIGAGQGVRQPLQGLGIAASGLTAQRARLDAISANIANAETTRGLDGTPYRRKTVRLEEVGFEPILSGETRATDPSEGSGGVRVVGFEEDLSQGPTVYDPGHPDADENGYVQMPNVDISTEMVDLMETRRLFEANVTVFQAIKTMLRRSTQI